MGKKGGRGVDMAMDLEDFQIFDCVCVCVSCCHAWGSMPDDLCNDVCLSDKL